MLKNYDLVIQPPEGDSEQRRIELIGTLDSHTVVGFEKSIQELLEEKPRRVVLSLENLTYISSAGISALMGLTHRLRQVDGDLILLKPSEKVSRVFRTLGFTSIFRIVETEAEIDAAI
ncbi:STAS domain-containing protein [soil metagenome]